MASGISRVQVGSYLGTGSAQDIKYDKVGFMPKSVKIMRKDTQQDLAEFVEGMDDDSLFYTDGSSGIRSLVTSNGITLNATGFTVGTHVGVNASDDNYFYVCEE